MKNRTNQVLLALFLITTAIYILALLFWEDVIPFLFDRLFHSDLPLGYFISRFHLVPCFLLQLLVCRTAKRTVVRLIPVFLLVGFAAWVFVGLVTATGWEGLEGLLRLLLCIAPAVGYALAWIVYGIGAWWKKRKGAQVE